MSLKWNKKPKNNTKSLPKDVLEAPSCTCKKGSLTVEAAMILPMLACFFAFLLFFFRVMLVSLEVQEALEETGSLVAMSTMEATKEKVLTATIFTAKLAGCENVKQYVYGGILGVSLIGSKWEEDRILLEAHYRMNFPVHLLGKRQFSMTQTTNCRRWTGWHPISQKQAEKITIYVTANGVAFHRRKSCPYIALSIQSVKRTEVGTLRNQDGECFGLCEGCGGDAPMAEYVYITNYGNKYHTSRSCMGLKRTIQEITYEQIGGRHPCPKCWK